MNLDLFDLKQTDNKGLGLFAKEYIHKGTVIGWDCKNCKTITIEEFQKMPEGKDKEFFNEHAFINEYGDMRMPCGTFKFMNHSCNSNILPAVGTDFDIAIRDINIGEEATYDYRVFYYPEENIVCKCGESNCCGIITNEIPHPLWLVKYWNEKILDALKYREKALMIKGIR